MPRRNYEFSPGPEPPKKKSSSGITNSIDLKQGEIITDLHGKRWKLGRAIGVGGFGEIYLVSDNLSREVKADTCYVAKIERHSNGPLFVEINCYLRIGKSEMIEEWKRENKLNYLGMPHYVSSGSHCHKGEKYRFLILPKYNKDLEKIFQAKKTFNIKTVLIIAVEILDVLEYIHHKGYVHSDIKASNIMLGKESETDANFQSEVTHGPISERNIKIYKLRNYPKLVKRRNLRPVTTVYYLDDIPYLDEILEMHEKKATIKRKDKTSVEPDHVYLLDYGLASKYVLSNGKIREFSTDQRRAHAGTVLFCSRDAHKGVPSRRSDLESLAYNMIYWLTGSLPWIQDVEQPEEVEKKKTRCFANLKYFLEFCFNNDYPSFLFDYFNYLNKLQFEENPDYNYCRKIFKKAIKAYGYKEDSVLDFDNLEDCGKKEKLQCKRVRGRENGAIIRNSFLKTNPLMPLHSNLVFKRPKLRKKANNCDINNSMMNWSKILTDPEIIIKQARERKTTEGSDPGGGNLSLIDLETMNPTSAMLEVYTKCKEREGSPRHKGDSFLTPTTNIDGYTPAMMNVYMKMQERKELEYEMEICRHNNNNVEVEFKLSRGPSRKRISKRTRVCVPPLGQKSPRTKSQCVIRQKDHIPVKKVKSVPLRRPYSLRG